jgi:WD40-like Beta Propeller Repeat
MNVLEDKLRVALRETGEEIAPHSVPPLQLRRARRRLGLPRPAARRWSAWLAPVAAAAAVTAVVTGSLAISGTFHSQHRHRHRPPVAGPAGTLASLPPYYIALTAPGATFRSMKPLHAVVRATATGAVLATIRPPAPYRTFGQVAAAGDGHTFVLAAGTWQVTHRAGGTFVNTGPARFFLLRISPHGLPGRLTPLPIPREPARAQISGIALSPDGSKLAIALRGGRGGGPGPEIQVFTLATGAERVWTWPGGGPITNNAGGMGSVLSWAADDKTLAFQQWAGNSIDVRLLNTAAPGGSLPSDSRLALQWKGDQESLRFVHGRAVNVIEGFSALITPDGTKIVCATVSETKRPLVSDLAFTEFSARTGRAVRVLGNWVLKGMYPGQTQDVLWTNRSGSTLIVIAHKPGKPSVMPRSTNVAGYGIEISALSGNRLTPIPGAPAVNSPNPWPAW